MKTLKENRSYIFLFFIFAALFSLFPLTGDDLGWATSDGMNLLKNNFDGYNGRYLGNLCAVFFTRFDLLRVAIKSSSFVFILYMLQKFTGRDEQFLYLSAAVLLVPYSPFIQCVVWSAGFFNYTFSLCFILPCFYILLNKHQGFYIPVIFVLGFAGQLFMETYTLLCLAVAFVVLIIRLFRKENRLIPLSYFASCVAGAAVMFSNSAYRQVMAGEQKYQKRADALQAVENLFTVVPGYVLYACIPAVLIIVVLLVFNKKYHFISLDKRRVTVCVMLALGLSLPFCVVGPIGTRCFFGVNLLLLLIIQNLTKELDIKRISKLSLIAVLCLNFAIYGVLYFSNQNKVENISQAVASGEKIICLEHTSFHIFAHAMDGEGVSKKILNRFCEYYGLPEGIEINFK